MISLKELIYGSSSIDCVITIYLYISVLYTIKVFIQEIDFFIISIFTFSISFFAGKFLYKYSYDFGLWVQDRFFVGKKNQNIFKEVKGKKNTRLLKVGDQSWQCFLHFTSTILELPLILTTDWWENPSDLFKPCPKDQEITFYMKFVYSYALSAYIYSGFCARYFNFRKNDYYVLFTHHCSTIMLIAGSYSFRYIRFGLVVLYLHDVSDIPVDSLILSNLFKLEGKEYYYFTEIVFVLCTSCYAIMRVFMFPFKLLIPLYKFRYTSCFEDGMLMFNFLTLLMSILYLMHWFWLFVFLRIFYNIVTMRPDEKREAVFEKDD